MRHRNRAPRNLKISSGLIILFLLLSPLIGLAIGSILFATFGRL